MHFFYEFQNGFLIDLHSKFKNFEIKLKAHFKVLIGDGENTKNSQLIEMDMSNSIVLAGNIFFQYDNSLENNRYHFSNSQKEPSNIEINTFGLDYDSIMPN